MLAKNLTFLAHADAAGIVLGARVPIVLTSRADSVRTRLASCAVAALYADARRREGRGAGGLMQAILVVNAGSSSLKFQIFAIDGDAAGAAGEGPDRRHRRAPAPARPAGADGAALVDRSYRAGGAARPARRHRASSARWLRASAASSSARSATASCTAAPTTTGRCGSTRTSSARLAALEPLAPLHQPNNLAPIRLAHGDRPGHAAGRLLRHRLPPRPPGAHRLLRPAARALRRGRAPLRLPRPLLRVRRRAPARRSRPRSPAAG